MRLDNAIQERRSVRSYSSRRVTDKVLEKLLQSGVQAPSACNRQDWRFISIRSMPLRRKITDMGAAPFILDAPVLLVVAYSNKTYNTEYADHVQSAAAAIQNINLKACSMGLATCWVCHLPPKRQLARLLGIPGGYEPVAAVTIGYPSSEPKPMPRNKPLYAVDRWAWKSSGKQPVLMRIGVRIYWSLPVFIRKLFNPFVDRNFVKKFRN